MVHTAAAFAKMQQPPADAGLHQLDRARRHQHGHRRRGRDDQPRCRCCCCPATSSPARTPAPVLQQLESSPVAGRLGQRLLQAGLALLGSHQSPRAAVRRAAGSDARADVAGRHRRGDAGAAAGRAGRGVRLSRTALFEPRVWTIPRPRPDAPRCTTAAALIRAGDAAARSSPAAACSTAKRPTRCASSRGATGIPVGETQAGKGALPFDDPQAARRHRRHRHDRPRIAWPATPISCSSSARG